MTESQPDQETVWLFAPAVPVRVTVEPCAKLALHVLPQSTPDGELVTVPVPAPFLLTVSSCGGPSGMTCVCEVAASFDGFASVLVLVTVAVLARSAVTLCGVTTTEMSASPFSASEPRLQVTVVVPEHDPWSGVAETRSTPAGSGSVTWTPAAAWGPLLLTWIA